MNICGKFSLNASRGVWVLISLLWGLGGIGRMGKKGSGKMEWSPSVPEGGLFLLEARSAETASKGGLETLGSLLVKSEARNSDSVKFFVGDIHIRLISEEGIEIPRVTLDVEFGNRLNPLYYNSLSSSDRCLLLLSRHFRTHKRVAFEEYIGRIGSLLSESHIYMERSIYLLEPKRADLKELGLILEYLFAFFSGSLLGPGRTLGEYLLDLQLDGNPYFMPDNFMRNLFLTVLNDYFWREQGGKDAFRDIYGGVRKCALGIRDRRLFLSKFGHFFRSRLRRVEIKMSKDMVALRRMEVLVKRLLRRIRTHSSGFNHLKALSRENPFLALTEGILQVYSNKVINRVTFLFPVVGEIRESRNWMTKYVKKMILGESQFRSYCKKQKWVSDIDFEFEYSKENGYSNLLVNFYSKWPLNSGEKTLKFNLMQLIESWLLEVGGMGKDTSTYNTRSQDNSSLSDQLEQRAKSLPSKYLGIGNMVIIIYSTKPISIRGLDILRLGSRMNEGKYRFLLRILHSILFLIRKNILPKLGIKYLNLRQDFYFGTKYLYRKLPVSISGFLKDKSY